MTALQRAKATRWTTEERLPFAPLERAVELRLEGGNLTDVAACLDVHRRQCERWRRAGVTWAQADVLAVRIGLHPAEVWHDWWERIEPEVEDVASTAVTPVGVTEPEDDLVHASGIALLLGVSRQRVHQLAAAGELPDPATFANHRRQWHRSTIEEWLSTRR